MRHLRPVVSAAIAVAVSAAICAPALAAVPSAGWSLHSLAIPTRFLPTQDAACLATHESQNRSPQCDGYQVTATNAGSVASEGAITLADTLPAAVSLQEAQIFWPAAASALGQARDENVFPKLVEGGFCTTTPLRCTMPFSVAPDESIEMRAFVTVNEAGPSTLSNSASVSGGNAPMVTTTSENPLGGAAPTFGATVSTEVTDAGGRPDTEAGSHPYEFSTRIDFNSEFRIGPDAVLDPQSIEDPRDIAVDLPLGFVGSALSAPRCTFAELSSKVFAGVGGCPTNTIVGHILTEPVNGDSVEGPIYNMVPERGKAAEFGFVDLLAGPHVLYASVAPSSGGYVLRTTAPELPQIPLTDVVATFFGDPSAKDAGGAQSTTFTNPANCTGGPLPTVVHMDSWQHPGGASPDLTGEGWLSMSTQTFPAGLTGCNLLQFLPTLSVQPEPAVAGAADSPAGLSVDMTLPQTEEPGTLATPPLRDAAVALPQGLTVDPASAGGLDACSEEQIGFKRVEPVTGTDEFTAAAPTCPEASKIGVVSLTTPLLATTLRGAVYLATPHQNPFGSLLAGYIVVDDPETGIVVKIAGELKADPTTGQITGVFMNNPQFPFTELKLKFKGGSRGVVATPPNCGTYTTTSRLAPWSAPDSGPPATPSSAFLINSGCVGGFAPSFSAGTTSPKAGGYSPFVMSFERADSDEEASGLTVTLPPGLLAKVAGVSRCANAQVAAAMANTGRSELAAPSCPESSQVGTVRAGSGPGPTPFFVSGKAYLTGPYRGAPYGLAVIVPAVAGPFDLGVVVVRAALHIDRGDGHVTAVSDPFPTMINGSGIPAHLKRVDVSLDRPDFVFNPTSCEAMAIGATLTSVNGLAASRTAHFQAAGCRELPFRPGFSASTQGKTSRVNGASLTVKVAQKPGEAGIRKVKVQLPRALPSRLSTLQKACTEAQFNANPAGCPAASNVGTATAITPVLNVPLIGPAYLVSHGGAAFPDLEFVLQGEGVEIVLDGKTQIKSGITYSKFETVPDAPISSFTTVLPEGPHSILGAITNLCRRHSVQVERHVSRRVHGRLEHVTVTVRKSVPVPLVMPTEIVGQNGATVTRNTAIGVTGCPKPSVKQRKSSK